MNSGARWWRFCLVGALGAALQLGVLAALKHYLGSHYVLASVVALEVTLLHNFIWHGRFTWYERHEGGDTMLRMCRFQLTNGGISLLGSLLFVPTLVHWLHAPVVAANAAAIPCCAALNFHLSERWAFAASPAFAGDKAVNAQDGSASLRANIPWSRDR